MTSEMIDRVLQAMKNHYGAHHMLLEIHGPGLARAAIEAMREPTEEMIEAAQKPQDHWTYLTGESVIERWQLMIDAALARAAQR